VLRTLPRKRNLSAGPKSVTLFRETGCKICRCAFGGLVRVAHVAVGRTQGIHRRSWSPMRWGQRGDKESCSFGIPEDHIEMRSPSKWRDQFFFSGRRPKSRSRGLTRSRLSGSIQSAHICAASAAKRSKTRRCPVKRQRFARSLSPRPAAKGFAVHPRCIFSVRKAVRHPRLLSGPAYPKPIEQSQLLFKIGGPMVMYLPRRSQRRRINSRIE